MNILKELYSSSYFLFDLMIKIIFFLLFSSILLLLDEIMLDIVLKNYSGQILLNSFIVIIYKILFEINLQKISFFIIFEFDLKKM